MVCSLESGITLIYYKGVNMDLYKSIGLKIKYKRKQKGFTQEMLSEACGISPSYIGIIERGDKRLSVETLVKIANALRVSSDYLLAENLVCDGKGCASSYFREMDEDEIRLAYGIIKDIRELVDKR